MSGLHASRSPIELNEFEGSGRMKQRQSSVLFFATALLSFAIENISASYNNIVMIGTGLLMSPSQLSYKPCLAFAGNNLSACNPLSPRRLAKSWSRAAAPTLHIMCQKIYIIHHISNSNEIHSLSIPKS